MYGAADLAGVSRLQYSTDIRLVRVMCSGRVDMELILRSFAKGADGVFIGGCRLGECNYTTQGNYHALNLTLLTQKILERSGIDPRRLQIKFMSGGEGNLFVEVVNDFIREVKALGPFGKAEKTDPAKLRESLAEIERLVPYIKIEKRDKLINRIENAADYENYFSAEEVRELLEGVVSYYIDPEKCQACMICARRCPVDAIEGGKNRVHVIDQDLCIKCGTCLDACPDRFGAVTRMTGIPVPPSLPEAERAIAKKDKTRKEKSPSVEKEIQ